MSSGNVMQEDITCFDMAVVNAFTQNARNRVLVPLALLMALLLPTMEMAKVYTNSRRALRHSGEAHSGQLHNTSSLRQPYKGRSLYSQGLHAPTYLGTVQHKQSPTCPQPGRPAQSFLIVFMGHSGSSAIMSELAAHSQVYSKDPEPVDHGELQTNTTLALEYTRSFFKRGAAVGKTAGFKIRPVHIGKDPEAWAALAREFNTRIIWQFRNNLLKHSVGAYSYKYLKDRSIVEGLRSETEKRNRCKTGVGCRFAINDFEFFHKTLMNSVRADLLITRAVQLLANGSTCVHALPYEEYLYNREEAMVRLQEFLGLRYEETTATRFKATGDNMCEVVENWKELCRNFYGCRVWRPMFHDPLNNCSCEFSTGHVKYCDTVAQSSN